MHICIYIYTWDIWRIISEDEKASSLLQSSSLRCDQHVCCCFVALFPRAVAELELFVSGVMTDTTALL